MINMIYINPNSSKIYNMIILLLLMSIEVYRII